MVVKGVSDYRWSFEDSTSALFHYLPVAPIIRAVLVCRVVVADRLCVFNLSLLQIE